MCNTEGACVRQSKRVRMCETDGARARRQREEGEGGGREERERDSATKEIHRHTQRHMYVLNTLEVCESPKLRATLAHRYTQR